ncbi:class I SAM-dependent methyltransferase [Flavobacteriaceae bacterium LMO-SS05]
MKVLHPHKQTPLSLSDLKDYYINGYYQIIDKEHEKPLYYFLSAFKDYINKSGIKPIDKHLYEGLPFSIHTDVWKERQKDAKIIDFLIDKRQNLKILDIGSWNGWLSNYQSKKGHEVVATNIFVDGINGLAANKNYSKSFISLQLFPDELFRLKYKFDIIVFNRNWSYINNRDLTLNDAKNLLNKNGVIILTGLPVYHNPDTINKKLKFADKAFKNDYGISLYYHTTKGYLNIDDINWLKKNSIKIYPYHKLKTMLLTLFPKKVKLYYGIYKN